MKPLPQTDPDPKRSCGDCQACCTTLEIRPLSTDDGPPTGPTDGEPVLTRYWERCQWQCGSGCAIYAHRPSPCAAYHCMWRLGWGDDDARPDRLGVLAEGAPNGWLFLVETRPGGVNEPLVQSYLKAMREHPASPCTAVNVLPWGAEHPLRDSYWLGSVPENLEAEFASVWEAIKGGA